MNSLYTNVLGRTGEAAGVQSWLNALTTGTSRATVAADFVNSPESTTRVVNGDYTAFLERVGEPSGVNFWLNQIQTKTLTLPQVAADFLGSTEYAGLAVTHRRLWNLSPLPRLTRLSLAGLPSSSPPPVHSTTAQRRL